MAKKTRTKEKAQPEQPAKRGRPSSFSPESLKLACDLATEGATDLEIATELKIDAATLYRWRHAHPEFREALEAGKTAADDRVERSLYHRSIGYSHPAVKIMQSEGSVIVEPYTEHYPPDTGAASLWLRNRRPDKWRDKQEIEHSGSVKIGLADRVRRAKERAKEGGK